MSSLRVPSVKWEEVREALLQVGQRTPSLTHWTAESFLATLGFIRPIPRPVRPAIELPPELWKRILLGLAEAAEEMNRLRWELTTEGNQLYMHMFVWRDETMASRLFADAAVRDPVVGLLLRVFYGRGLVTAEQLVALFKLQGIGHSESAVDSFIGLLHGMNLVERFEDGFIVRELSTEIAVPDAYLLAPDTPYSNRRYLQRLIAHCEGTLHWIDKFYSREAFEFLIDAADATRLDHIIIVSGQNNLTESAIQDYYAAKMELANRGIHLEWRICTHVETLKVWHGRWIVSDAGAFNIPPVRSLVKGQYDEIVPTENRPPIEHFLAVSRPVDPPAPALPPAQ